MRRGVCRKCRCTESDCQDCVERTGRPCWWVEADLCSACLPRFEVLGVQVVRLPASAAAGPDMGLAVVAWPGSIGEVDELPYVVGDPAPANLSELWVPPALWDRARPAVQRLARAGGLTL